MLSLSPRTWPTSLSRPSSSRWTPIAGTVAGATVAARPRWRRARRGPSPQHHRPSPVQPTLATDLGSLASAVRTLITPDLRPAFLGNGAFGGPWANRQD